MTSARAMNSRTADLINHDTEWGLSVSEASGRRNLSRKLLALAGYGLVFLGSVILLPVIIGFALFPDASGLAIEALLILALIAAAFFLHAQSKKGPKNALQLDFQAGEVRLGSINTRGAFVRHRVCNFAQIEEARVDDSDPSAPALCLDLGVETAKVRLKNAPLDDVRALASKINAARMAARAAPVRQRVQSALMGFEASAREIGHRVRSRVASRSI